jgi:calcium/calmodulin-dependent protein kinase I
MDYDQIDMLRTTCGTPGYIAPEILNKTGHGKPCDLWSIGCMTYFLLVGYLPFENDDRKSDYNRLRAAEFTFHESDWKDISPEAKNFIASLLVLDTHKRMTVSDALSHPWVAINQPTVVDLLPRVREGFNSRKVFKKAYEAVRVTQMLNSKTSLKNL